MWGPKTIAKLVQTTPITLVYDAQVTIPMLQGAGIFTNICPCPKSPSFVGFYIPAPRFAYGIVVNIPSYDTYNKLVTVMGFTNQLWSMIRT